MRYSKFALAQGSPFKAALAIGLAGFLLAGCSSSIDRFADYPGKGGKSQTASASRQTGSTYSEDYIESSAIGGSPARTASNPYKPPIYSQTQNYNQVRTRQPQYQVPAYQEPQYQEPQYEEPQYQDPSYQDQGETGAVIVEPGQTLYSIARANGMTVATLAEANGIQAPYHLRAGQRIRVPGVNEPRAVATYAPAQQNFSQKSAGHVVKSGETLFSLGRKYGLHPYKIADFNDISHNASLRTGQKVRIPGGGKSADRIASEESYEQIDEPQQQYADAEGPSGKTDYEPQETEDFGDQPANDPEMTADVSEEAASEPVEETTGNFRWPVRGRIISKYGAKPGGARNEGINIAVPEGTSVRAAEGGVIAYAGNELKGYGNLILIRHPEGWVTAYAHNKQLLVRRGDTVKRGDVIAKAGQTGSVESPQLHFELRRGATAVDPMKYLVSAQAATY